MNIGIDITAIKNGRGPGRYVSEAVSTLSGMETNGDKYYLYSPYPVSEKYPSNFIPRHVPLQKYRPWLNWTLPRAARKDRIDIMFFPANDFWLWPFTKTVVTILDVAPATVLSGFYRSWSDKLQNKLQMARLGKVADKIITISEYSSSQIQKVANIPVNKISAIYCGVSSNYCPPATGKARGEFILYVGGFDRRKNLERLLDAYNLLLGSGSTEKLIMAGHSSPGGYDKLYYDMSELLRSKNLTGKVEIIENPTDDKIIQLYQTAKLFVFPSLIEGFGLPVLEAMACGCPVACSNAASLPEVGGNAALYFEPYDVQAIADTLLKIIIDDQLRNKIIENGYAQTRKFSWLKAGQEIYDALAKTYLSKE